MIVVAPWWLVLTEVIQSGITAEWADVHLPESNLFYVLGGAPGMVCLLRGLFHARATQITRNSATPNVTLLHPLER